MGRNCVGSQLVAIGGLLVEHDGVERGKKKMCKV